MSTPTPPHDEPARLARLRELVVLDTPPEPLFDSIARLASQACGVPIALISLVDGERQWFKANVGLPGVNETPRDIAFCAHAIEGDALFEVPDATRDARFAGNPLVTGNPDIRFYAGAPLVMPDGARMGTLCVIDREARRLDASQAAMLQGLAAIASQALVMRHELIAKSLAVRTEYERALGDSERRYRAIVEEQTELVSLARPDGKLVYANPAYAQHFGRLPAQIEGRSLYDFVEPADRDAVRALLADVLRTGTSRSTENRMIAANGQERWVAWTNSAQAEADGSPMVHSVGRDVTARHRAEAALRASENFLRRTGRVAGVGGWELELASGKLIWSEQTRHIHEVGPEYVPTLEAAIAFYAPSARPSMEAAVRVAVDDGKPWDLELPFVTATGRAIWVRAVGEAEFEAGKPVRLVGAFQDITERKSLQQRAADNERFLRQVTDGLPVRIAYIDRQRRYRFVNRLNCERFGLAREQILGRTRSELLPGADIGDLSAHFDAVLAGQAQRFEFDEQAAGGTRRFETQWSPDIAADGQVQGFFSTSIDITERSASERALRLLTTIFDNTTDYVVQADWRGQVTYMNPAVRQALALTPDEPVTHHSFADFNTAATNRLFTDEILPTVKATGVWLGETTVLRAHGQEVPVSHMVIAHRGADGRIERYSAVMRDISTDVAAKHDLMRQTATLRSVTEAIPAIIAVVGSDGRYRFVNSAFERWIGSTRDRIVGRTLTEVLGRSDAERSRPWVDRVLAGETVSFERAHPGRGQARHLALSYIPLWLEDGVVDGFVGVGQDVTQAKHEEIRLLQLAQRDALTGLLNRAGFEDELERRMQDGGGAALALLYIDLDHFKPVNDQHGHPTGDQVLQLFAQRIRALVRPTDAVARLGGDEFAVLLSGVRALGNAQTVADKVVDAARAPFEVGALRLSVGASVGIAFGVDPALGWPDLVARADAMLYRAKAGGRGRHATQAT